jgi:ParB-like chromosome segregation protein Spo0J
MAKLTESIVHAGMNSGATVIARMARTSEIRTDPALEKIFAIKEGILEAIIKSMKESGYDKAEPIVVWKGKNIAIDGHTRLKAAIAAGITEIPVEEKEFASLDEAREYTRKRQINRRNLNQSEIFDAAAELQNKQGRDGTGRAAEILAKELGVSPSTVHHARAVAASAPLEVIDQVKQNKLSINQAYNIAKKKSPKKGTGEFEKTGARIHKTSIKTLSESPAAQKAFGELLERLQALEASGEIAAPVYQDVAALLKPFLSHVFLDGVSADAIYAPDFDETTGDAIES